MVSIMRSAQKKKKSNKGSADTKKAKSGSTKKSERTLSLRKTGTGKGKKETRR